MQTDAAMGSLSVCQMSSQLYLCSGFAIVANIAMHFGWVTHLGGKDGGGGGWGVNFVWKCVSTCATGLKLCTYVKEEER